MGFSNSFVNHEVTIQKQKRTNSRKSLNPQISETYIDVNRNTFTDGKRELLQALKELKKSYISVPENVYAKDLTREARFYSNRTLHEYAKRSLSEAHRLLPTDLNITTAMSECFLNCGQFTEALMAANVVLSHVRILKGFNLKMSQLGGQQRPISLKRSRNSKKLDVGEGEDPPKN